MTSEPLAIVNFNSELQFVIHDSTNIKENLEKFCYKHSYQDQFEEIYSIIKSQLKEEEDERKFNKPQGKQLCEKLYIDYQIRQEKQQKARMERKKELSKDCTFSPHINNQNYIFEQQPVYERLNSKKSRQSDKEIKYEFQPKINRKSREIAKVKEQQEQKVEDSLNKKMLISFGDANQFKKSDKVKNKYCQEKLQLMLIIFNFLDEDHDNLLSFNSINWSLLNTEVGHILFPLIQSMKCECKEFEIIKFVQVISFTQFINTIDSKGLIDSIVLQALSEPKYRELIPDKLYDQLIKKNGTYEIEINEFIKQVKNNLHKIDSIGPVSKRYHKLLLMK